MSTKKTFHWLFSGHDYEIKIIVSNQKKTGQ